MPTPNLDLAGRARELQAELSGWRRAIHRYPELSFDERRTSALVAETLRALGLEPRTGVAKTGVVAEVGRGERLVALRADMDALPIQEANDSDFDSLRPGLMHACGHDAHTAMLLGAASLLKGLEAEGALPGRVRLLFQPSEEAWDEEGKSGARRMVEEGALSGVEAVFGLHVEASLSVGELSTRSGPFMAAVDDFNLTLRGSGGHAAEPHLTVDLIAQAGLVINAVHQIVSRRLDPVEAGLITIGSVHGGRASNVIPERLVLTGTIRSLSEAGRERMHAELRKVVLMIEALGGEADLTFTQGYPVTRNDPTATEVARAALSRLGEVRLYEAPLMLGSEDFSFMAEAAPGCFLLLGVRDPAWEQEYPVHTPTFRLDERALPVGASALAALALEGLESGIGN